MLLKTTNQLAELADYLADKQEAILQAFWETVLDDPESPSARAVSLTHFRNLLPKLLTIFQRQLLEDGAAPSGADLMSEHGLHRWQQSYSLREVVREWGLLQIFLLGELERYALAHPDLEPGVMAYARRTWVALCSRAISESVEQYASLREAEARGVLRELQQAMEKLKQLERERADAWHQAAHDLRGNVGLVTSSTSLLSEDGIPEPLRNKAFGILQASVSSLHQLLEDLMGLARLEAGREERQLDTLNVAEQLRSLGEALQPLAEERGLYLKLKGPARLEIETDPAKLHRIVQNLALNALKYTETGGVTIRWGETMESDIDRWWVRIEDTGPGFQTAETTISGKLEESTKGSWASEVRDPASGVEPTPRPHSPSGLNPATDRGEGIGLSIVKRLCEILDGALELASQDGKGTIAQVVLPRRYGDDMRPNIRT